jgi:hypothetical protein
MKLGTNEMLATLEDVVTRLDALKVPYMVTGSFAMSTYATARTTMDIDIVMEVASIDAAVFEAKFQGDYYVNAASIRRALEHQSMFNMLSNITGVKVDCIVRKDTRTEVERFGRRRLATLGGVQFWAITKEDLILSKLRWAKDSHSEMQFRDVDKLLESGVDETAIVDQARHEGLNQVWDAFEEWKIQAAK